MIKKTVGVLALQGDFDKHAEVLNRLGVDVKMVRTPGDLEACQALIIPGGESTSIFRQLNFISLIPPILKFSEKNPIFGTCAGLILMSKEIVGEKFVSPMGLLDVVVQRNAYGRQGESFSTELEVSAGTLKPFAVSAFFIRAPRIQSCGPEVSVLAKFDDQPTLVQQGKHLGATFHPELTQDSRIHKYFLSLIL